MFYRYKFLRSYMAALLLVATSLFAAGCGSSRTVAVVNEEKITRKEFDSYINLMRFIFPYLDEHLADKSTRALLEEELLETMVEKILIRQDMERQGMVVSEEDIEATYGQTRLEFIIMYENEEQFTKALQEYKITEYDLRDLLGSITRLQKLYESFQQEMTDDEILAFLRENPDYATIPAMIEPSHILLSSEEEALAARERLTAGEDFAALAEELSLDPYAEYGYLDNIAVNDPYWDPDFMAAAVELNVGDISLPVETVHGWHLIVLNSRTEATELSFEEVRESVAEAISNEKLHVYYDKLRAEADVKVSL